MNQKTMNSEHQCLAPTRDVLGKRGKLDGELVAQVTRTVSDGLEESRAEIVDD